MVVCQEKKKKLEFSQLVSINSMITQLTNYNTFDWRLHVGLEA